MKNLLKLSFLLLFIFSSGCTTKCPAPEKLADETNKIAPEQRQLNYGYALLYSAFDSFQSLNTALTLKKENQQVHDAIKNLTDTTKKLHDTLDEFKKDYPNLKLDDTGRPDILEKKGKAQGKERISEYFPIIGKTGKEYERSLLIFLTTALNELKFISNELSKMEPNESLKKFLIETNGHMITLEDQMLKILNKEYFKEDYFESQKTDKK